MPLHTNRRGVLLVDDEESIRFALAQYLTAEGYAVDVARSRAEAESLFVQHRHPIVITDLQLTPGDPRGGLELIGSVRARAPRTTTILVTAYGCPDLPAEARQLGCDLVLSKPIPLGAITQALADLAGRRAHHASEPPARFVAVS